MSRKQGVLRCFGAALVIKTCAHLLKAFVKPDFEYCLHVKGKYGMVRAISINKLPARAKELLHAITLLFYVTQILVNFALQTLMV